MHHPSNWLMRIMLVAVLGSLLLLVPVALGQDVSVSGDARLGTVPLDPGAPPTAEDAAQAAEVTLSAEGAPTGDVQVSSDDATAAVAASTPTTESASGELGVLSSASVQTKTATAGAIVAAVGSAGALFWLKNALGLALGRFLGAPLFSRLSKDDLLTNDGRETLFNLVESNPGINLADLADQSGLGWGTTVYHLGRLEQAGFITSMKNGQARHFFKNGHPAAKSKKAVAVLKNDTAAQVARFLLATPGATGKTIAAGLGIAPPTVTKYVQRLEAEGLVETLKDGRSKIVQPTGLLAEAMQHVDATTLPTMPAPTAPVHGVSAYA